MARNALQELSRPLVTAVAAGLLVVLSRWLLFGAEWRLVNPALKQQRQRLGWAAAISAALLRLRGGSITDDQWCRVIAAWARRLPGAHCLVQAMAAEAMLRVWRRRVVLRIGVADHHGSFAAHAWLERDGIYLIGGSDAGAFQALRFGAEVAR